MPSRPTRGMPPECHEFFSLFIESWNARKGLPAFCKSQRLELDEWTRSQFLIALERVGGVIIQNSTLGTWTRFERWPREENRDAIIAVFCGLIGDNTIDQDLKNSFLKAWHRGQSALRTYSDNVEEQQAPNDLANDIWDITPANVAVPGLISVDLASPEKANADRIYYVRGRAFFDISENVTKEGETLLVGLNKALLVISGEGIRVLNGTYIGERSANASFRSKPSGTEIIGPLSDELEGVVGNPIGDDYIVQIQLLDVPSHTIDMSIYAFEKSFVARLVTDGQPDISSDELSKKKKAILNALLRRKKKTDDQGRILVAADSRYKVNVK